MITTTATKSSLHLSFTAAIAMTAIAMCGAAADTNLLLNSSFENGGTTNTPSGNTFVDANNSKAIISSPSDTTTITSWGVDRVQWIADASRATDGVNFLWLAGGQTYCAGQLLSLGAGQSLEAGQTYRFQYDYAAVAFSGGGVAGEPGDSPLLGTFGTNGPRLELSYADAAGVKILSPGLNSFEADQFINAFTGASTSLTGVQTWNSLVTDVGTAGSGWTRAYLDYTLPTSGIPLNAAFVLVSFSNSSNSTLNAGLAIDNAFVAAIPETSTTLLVGLFGLVGIARRRR